MGQIHGRVTRNSASEGVVSKLAAVQKTPAESNDFYENIFEDNDDPRNTDVALQAPSMLVLIDPALADSLQWDDHPIVSFQRIAFSARGPPAT